MMLGDLMTRLSDQEEVGRILADLGDPELSRQFGDDPGEAARAAVRAVRRFVEEADDEAWVSLVSALGRAEDPARAGLRNMLRRGLAGAPTRDQRD